MKLLVLGAQGMLGQEIVVQARAAGFDVLAWDRAEIDVTDKGALDKIRAEKPDVLVNCVAYNAVDDAESPDGWSTAEMLNAQVPGRLAAVARELGTTFVHFSTDYVFDGECDAGYAEDAEPAPISAYGRSKMMGELAVQSMGGHYYLVRLTRLFGKPATSAAGKRSFVDVMSELGRTREAISLVDEERGCPTYAPDLAAAVLQLLADKPPAGIYHLTNEGACTWYEFGKEVFALTGSTIQASPVPASAFPRPARRPRTSELLNTKRPHLRSWKDALRAYLTQAV